MQGRRTSWIAAALAALAVMGAPEAAGAATGQIAGNPLIVYADGLGQLQIRYGDQAEGVFYGDDEDVANAGLELRVGELAYVLGSSERTAVSGPTLAIVAPGTRALRSVWRAGDLQVAEDVTYTDGTETVRLRYAITNVGSAPVSFAAGELADLYGAGDDQGRGILQAGPPRFVGGLSDNGALTGLVETTPWAHYQSGYYSSVFSDFRSAGLTDAIDPEYVDNGAGAEWRFDAVAPGDTRIIDVDWRVGAATVDRRVTTTADHTPDDLPDPCAAPSDCTLREALLSSSAGSVIELPAGTYELERGELYLGDVSLRGAGAGVTTISGAGRGRVLYVSSRASLSGVRITGGTGAGESASGNGGGIYVGVESELTLNDVAVTGNAAPGSGGGIFSRGTLTVMRSVIAGNEAALAAEASPSTVGAPGWSTRQWTPTVPPSAAACSPAAATGRAPQRHALGQHRRRPVHQPADARVRICCTRRRQRLGREHDPGRQRRGRLRRRHTRDQRPQPGRRRHLRARGPRRPRKRRRAARAAARRRRAAADRGQPGGRRRRRPGVPERRPGRHGPPAARPLRRGRVRVARCRAPAAAAARPPTPAPTATPAPPVDTRQLPPPVAGKTVNAVTKSGTVLIKLRGQRTFVALGPGQQVPVGTEIDTRKGRITLTAAADKRGGTQTADFYSGIFKVTQTGGSKPTTVLDASPRSCRARRASGPAPRRPRRRRASCGATARAASARPASTAPRPSAARSG